jgi:hypothetical protein
VLPGVEYMFFDAVSEAVAYSTADGGSFDDLGASPYDGEKMHDVYAFSEMI